MGRPGSWDDRALESGQCFKDKDTSYWYYHAYSEAGKDAAYQIGVATASSPEGTWTKYNNNPILETSEDNDWENQYVPALLCLNMITPIICGITVLIMSGMDL